MESAYIEGYGGAIRIEAPIIELLDGTVLEATNYGVDEGGEVVVVADEHLTMSGTGAHGLGSSIIAGTESLGAPTVVEVSAPVVELNDGAYISTYTSGAAPGGALSVVAGERLSLSGADVYGQGSNIGANVFPGASGDGGAVYIEAPVISLTDGAWIASASGGSGEAGEIKVVADDTLELFEGSTITTEALIASGGNIDIEVGNVLYLNDSEITTTVGSGAGRGGDIAVNADLMVLNDGRITAQADDGNGGNIRVSANQLLTTSDSVIDASAGPAGIDGSVLINSAQSNLAEKLVRHTPSFLDAHALLEPGCDARANGSSGSFTVAHQQGLPLSPESVLLAFDANSHGLPIAAPMKVSMLSDTSKKTGDSLRGIALQQQANGYYSASLDTLNAALVDNGGRQLAATLGDAANAYLALGQTDTAVAYFNQAIAEASEDEYAVLTSLHNNLGNLYMVRQDFIAAAQSYTQSVQYARRVMDALQEAKALANGARAVLAASKHKDAAQLLQQARGIAQTLVASHEKAYVLIHLARSARKLGTDGIENEQFYLAAAYTDLRDAVKISSDLGDQRTLSYALGNLGMLYQQQGRLDEALYLTRSAQRAAEQAQAPESHYRWHWQAGQLLSARGEYQSALEAYRRAVAILEGSRLETLAQYGASHTHFRQAVAPVYLDFVDALLQHSSRVQDPSALLLEARAVVEQFKAAELRDYFRDECITELEAKNTRLENVSPSAAVVYPIILPDRLELLVSLPDGLRRYPVAVAADTLGQVVMGFRRTVEQQGSERQLLYYAQQLYDWLVGPYISVLGEAGIDTLVFVPDGPLRTAPLAALHNGEDYLIRHYGVVVTPGLSLTDPRPLDRDAPRLVLAGLSDAVQNFPPLPHVPKELEYIQQLFGGRVLLDEEFTLSRVGQMLDVPVSMLHLASHAQFSGEAGNSFLLTHDGRLSMEQLSDVLEVARFREQPLELLVLSACQTAVGDERAAMGLAGIGLKAGARSAVGSLWFISDEGTAELMSGFYRKLKDPALTKAQALQQAQQAMLADGRFSHPFYWSPFLLMNNWL